MQPWDSDVIKFIVYAVISALVLFLLLVVAGVIDVSCVDELGRCESPNAYSRR